MTTDHLAAVLAALDAATEAEARMGPPNWRYDLGCVFAAPGDGMIAGGIGKRHGEGIALARNQWPALLRLARAVAEHIAARRAEADERNAHPDNLASPESRARSFAAMRAMDAALLALAPDTEGD